MVLYRLKLASFLPMILSVGIFLTGCTNAIISDFLTFPCETTVWNRSVDALPSPAYTERHQTGEELMLMGAILDADTCQPIPGATVMFDLASENGDYDGTQRGTVYTSSAGIFMVQSAFPGTYGGGNPHIHLFIGAEGYQPLTASFEPAEAVRAGWLIVTLEQVL